MVSTVTLDDEVVHNTCCFDLDIFLSFVQGYESLNILPRYTINRGHFVDTIIAPWTIWYWLSIMVSTVS